jgi:hypothetical protein
MLDIDFLQPGHILVKERKRTYFDYVKGRNEFKN